MNESFKSGESYGPIEKYKQYVDDIEAIGKIPDSIRDEMVGAQSKEEIETVLKKVKDEGLIQESDFDQATGILNGAEYKHIPTAIELAMMKTQNYKDEVVEDVTPNTGFETKEENTVSETVADLKQTTEPSEVVAKSPSPDLNVEDKVDQIKTEPVKNNSKTIEVAEDVAVLNKETKNSESVIKYIKYRLKDLSEPYGISMDSYSDTEILGFIDRAGVTEEELSFWVSYYDQVTGEPYAIIAYGPDEKRKIDVIDQKFRTFYQREYWKMGVAKSDTETPKSEGQNETKIDKKADVGESAESFKPTQFTTAMGSIYTYLPDGRTKRFKTATNESMEAQDICVFIPPFEKIAKDAKRLMPDIFEKIQTQSQFEQLLLGHIHYKGYTVLVVDGDRNEINSHDEFKKAQNVFLAFIDTKNPKNSFTLPVSKDPVVGYNTFDTRFFNDASGVPKREVHIGNKVIEIKYK